MKIDVFYNTERERWEIPIPLQPRPDFRAVGNTVWSALSWAIQGMRYPTTIICPRGHIHTQYFWPTDSGLTQRYCKNCDVKFEMQAPGAPERYRFWR